MTALEDAERLDALTRSGLLSKTVAQQLDHLVFAAARILLVDATELNAVDEAYQYTVRGFPPDVYTEDKIPRVYPLDHSACRRVVELGQPLAIDDTRSHVLTKEMPWNAKYGAYLGVPITFHGHVLGSLCALNQGTRFWKSYEIAALSGVARLASMSLQSPDRP